VAPPVVFSAGEVEKYAYCPLSWWLSRGLAEEEGPEIFEGEAKHAILTKDLAAIRSQEDEAREFETGVLYFAVAASVLALLGIAFVQALAVEVGLIFGVNALIWLLASVYFLYKAETVVTPRDRLLAERLMLVFAIVATLLAAYSFSTSLISDPILAGVVEVVALVWLVGASFYLYRAMKALQAARATRARLDVEDGVIAYVDDEGQRPELLEARAHGLRGRPDYVLVRDESLVPVEVKTGRTPRGPLFSHILQVAAYCLLVEETYGRPPPYGILQYDGASHEIEYNDDLKGLLLAKLEEMRAALAAGEAHRNHNRPGKCLRCSRRSVCPERLA
jgi:CRISPR-associated exonuclease Cas4